MMEDELLKYGGLGLGLIIAGIIGKIALQKMSEMEKSHKEERKEFRQTIEKQFDEQNKTAEEHNKITRENTGILQGLKTLLENRRP